MKLRLLILAPILLVGCAVGGSGFTPEQELAVVCRGYASTLTAVVPFKPRMTEDQIAFVNQANVIVIPTCKKAATGQTVDPLLALDIVRDQLRQMLLIESQYKGEGA